MSPQEPTPTPDDESAEIIETAILEELDLGGDAKSCAGAILEALKSAGYELVNQVGTVHESPKFGVTKGLPGIGDALDKLAPGAASAARVGMELANRHIQYAGQEAGKALAGMLDAVGFVDLTGSLMAEVLMPRLTKGSAIMGVALPEPDSDGTWLVEGPGDWIVHTGGNNTSVFMETIELYEFAPTHARSLAAALLAAAAKAEAGE